MFCDLVGSTSLAAGMDAEDWRNLVGAWLDAASAAVTGLGGHVLSKLGEGLMALFGYPLAQENDAERAVPGGLYNPAGLGELNARNAGNVRRSSPRDSALSSYRGGRAEAAAVAHLRVPRKAVAILPMPLTLISPRGSQS